MKSTFDERVPPLVLDREKIKQVFMNLLMNARHAIGKKGAIALSTHYDAQQHQVEIRVSDNGCGIEPQFLTRIFDPFFTTKATGEGTGLGLSVSYGIVKDHGGDIVVSTEPGAGVHLHGDLAGNTRGSPGSVMKETLLVVDDEQDMLQLLKRSLETDLDCHVETALSGEAALQFLQQSHVDLVLADIRMPDMDGLELLGKIRRNTPG